MACLTTCKLMYNVPFQNRVQGYLLLWDFQSSTKLVISNFHHYIPRHHLNCKKNVFTTLKRFHIAGKFILTGVIPDFVITDV